MQPSTCIYFLPCPKPKTGSPDPKAFFLPSSFARVRMRPCTFGLSVKSLMLASAVLLGCLIGAAAQAPPTPPATYIGVLMVGEMYKVVLPQSRASMWPDLPNRSHECLVGNYKAPLSSGNWGPAPAPSVYFLSQDDLNFTRRPLYVTPLDPQKGFEIWIACVDKQKYFWQRLHIYSPNELLDVIAWDPNYHPESNPPAPFPHATGALFAMEYIGPYVAVSGHDGSDDMVPVFERTRFILNVTFARADHINGQEVKRGATFTINNTNLRDSRTTCVLSPNASTHIPYDANNPRRQCTRRIIANEMLDIGEYVVAVHHEFAPFDVNPVTVALCNASFPRWNMVLGPVRWDYTTLVVQCSYKTLSYTKTKTDTNTVTTSTGTVTTTTTMTPSATTTTTSTPTAPPTPSSTTTVTETPTETTNEAQTTVTTTTASPPRRRVEAEGGASAASGEGSSSSAGSSPPAPGAFTTCTPVVLFVPDVFGTTVYSYDALIFPRLPIFFGAKIPADEMQLANPLDLIGWNALRKELAQIGFRSHSVAYDWSLPVEDILNTYFIPAIQRAKEENAVACEGGKDGGGGTVAVVAHGFGGILVRSYMQRRGYAKDIGKVVFLGTPHLGAAVFYPFLNGNAPLSDVLANTTIPLLFTQVADYQLKDRLADGDGYCDTINVRSVKDCRPAKLFAASELIAGSAFDSLPVYNDFLVAPDGTFKRLFMQENRWLKALNGMPCLATGPCKYNNGTVLGPFIPWGEVVDQPDGHAAVDVLVVVGVTDKTVVRFRTKPAAATLAFPDGYVDRVSDAQLGTGDDIVWRDSAIAIVNQSENVKIMEIDASHTELLHESLGDIVGFLQSAWTPPSLRQGKKEVYPKRPREAKGMKAAHRTASPSSILVGSGTVPMTISVVLSNPGRRFGSALLLPSQSGLQCYVSFNGSAPVVANKLSDSFTSTSYDTIALAASIDVQEQDDIVCDVLVNATVYIQQAFNVSSNYAVHVTASAPSFVDGRLVVTSGTWWGRIPAPPVSAARANDPSATTLISTSARFLVHVADVDADDDVSAYDELRLQPEDALLAPPAPIVDVIGSTNSESEWGVTRLAVDVDIAQSFRGFFSSEFPPSTLDGAETVWIVARGHSDDPFFYERIGNVSAAAVRRAIMQDDDLVVPVSVTARSTSATNVTFARRAAMDGLAPPPPPRGVALFLEITFAQSMLPRIEHAQDLVVLPLRQSYLSDMTYVVFPEPSPNVENALLAASPFLGLGAGVVFAVVALGAMWYRSKKTTGSSQQRQQATVLPLHEGGDERAPLSLSRH